ncbi:MAG: hypothetical protein IIU63_04270, partial [Clostridia bacterium]|nr:hypothetical protein [Clostridia bacterium]
SRFDDGEDPFPLQWRRMVESVQNAGRVFLMGDFNCPAECVGEGYDRILSDGWYDAFAEARRTKGRDTASGVIDGWGDQSHNRGIRIDYILTNDHAVKFCRCETVFDPLRGQVAVSDHCGVLCETEEGLW